MSLLRTTHSPIENLTNERKILKAFLLERLYQIIAEEFHSTRTLNQNDDQPMECYAVDSKIIQFLIENIIQTGEYTLEGISRYTRIPFDVIYDAACGITHQFSITPWVRIMGLYIQVNPSVVPLLTERLLETKNKSREALTLLLNEPL